MSEPHGTLVAGRYRIEAMIARGGMGEVYAARDEALQRPVALKLMPDTEVRLERDVERFHRQAQAAARIPHQGVVQIYDRGLHDQRPFLVMERLDGETLEQRLERAAPLGPGFCARVCGDLAHAVHAAHTAGIVHRDLKPSNVFLALLPPHAEMVKVLDFGVAKVLDAAPLTKDDEVMGTPRYMAPELLSGARRADARTDVYGIGCILYELLAGRPPFGANARAELMLQIRNDPPPRIARADLPPELFAIVSCALAKAAADRFASAYLLARELHRVAAELGEAMVEHEATAVRPVGTGLRAVAARASSGPVASTLPPIVSREHSGLAFAPVRAAAGLRGALWVAGLGAIAALLAWLWVGR